MSDFPPPSQDPSGYSNYPRDIYGGGDPNNPYQRPPGVYFDSFSQAWKIAQLNLGTWVLATLVSLFLPYICYIPINFGLNVAIYGSIMGPTAFDMKTFVFSILIGLIPGQVFYIFHTGLLCMGVKQARGEVVVLGDLFIGFRRFGSILLAGVISTIVIYTGLILLLVPGLFVIGLLGFYPIIIIEKNLSPLDALKEVYGKIGSQAWAIFAFMFVGGLMETVSACCCLVPLLFTTPIYIIGMGLTYNNFFPRPRTEFAYQPIGVEPPR